MKKLVILIALILLLDLTEQYSKDVFGVIYIHLYLEEGPAEETKTRQRTQIDQKERQERKTI